MLQTRSKHIRLTNIYWIPELKQQPQDVSFDYKYTSIANEQAKVTLARFDATTAADHCWTVLSVDGKPPSQADIKKFKKEHPIVVNASSKIDDASMKVEESTEDKLVISYKRDPASFPAEGAFLKDCRNYLTIDRIAKGWNRSAV